MSAIDMTKQADKAASTGESSPWYWIPTVYIAEGLPYFAVNTLTVLMYHKLGIGLKEMAFFTGWLYLPWVIKPFWSPFIDLFKTKRFWTLSMQYGMAIALALIGFMLPTPFFFTVTLVLFWLTAFFSATHDIAADGYYMIVLPPHRQAAFVGIRSTFYRVASVLGQGGLVMFAGYLENRYGNIPNAWSAVFIIIGLLFLGIAVYDTRFMPVSNDDRPRPGVTARTILHDFADTFFTFFQKKGFVTAIMFMLLYRLPEALCIKLVQPFMVSPLSEGGLGLTTAEVGFANGTVGVIALLTGGIIGGIVISRNGLKKWLWPMAMSLTLPCILYCLLAMFQPSDFSVVCAAVGVEQFGYGFGFTAFMMYLIYFCRGENQTSHYAFCTAFMALGMMLPGMIAGWVHEKLTPLNIFDLSIPQGYVNFFWLVILCSLATFAVCARLRIAPEFGKKIK